MKPAHDTRRLPAAKGLLAHLVKQRNPQHFKEIAKTGVIETAIYGLGDQGRRHAALMAASGTQIVAAVAPGYASAFVHETIPVYASVAEMQQRHPNVTAISIWKHFTSAPQAAMEAIDAGIPIVVLISEGIPVQDAQRLRAAAHRNKVLLFGPNTPGVIFPPESIKIGMLPDVFQPAEDQSGKINGSGVTILSRSGAILYHLADALSAAGIAQNGVLGIGGDTVVGADFVDLVPLAMSYAHTDAVVIAGEIGGAKEEILAQDIEENPKRYPKPIVALLSGRYAPMGKTMGHAGAIISPGANYGTYDGKKRALQNAGVTVVNGQTALVKAVRKALGGRKYFLPDRYRAKMRELWEVAPAAPTWTTHITEIAPNRIAVRGTPIQELIGKVSIAGAASLLCTGSIPRKARLKSLDELACRAADLPPPKLPNVPKQKLSQFLAASLLCDALDESLTNGEASVAALGRVVRFIATFSKAKKIPHAANFAERAAVALGLDQPSPKRVAMIEAMIVASIDHGVTPPSAQATILAASVRASFAACIASGLNAITEVHGGAGESAAAFFLACSKSDKFALSPLLAVGETIREYSARGRRIDGLGHRVHTVDPRRDVLLELANRHGVAGAHVAIAQVLEDAFENVRGIRLPLNVDGVIGAIVADMGLPPQSASAIFLLGRTAGLAAHYFEEIASQQPMRQINFAQAVYREG